MIDSDTRKKASEIRDRIKRSETQSAALAFNQLTQGKKGSIVGIFSERMSDEERRRLWGWIYQKSGEPLRPLSSKELDVCQWTGLSDWISAAEVGGVWLPQPLFYIELAQVKAVALEAFSLSEGSLESADESSSDPTMVETAIALGGVVTEIEPESITDAAGYPETAAPDGPGPVCSDDDDDDPLWFLTPPSPLVLPDVIEYLDPAPAPAPDPSPVTLRLKYKTRSSGAF